MRGTDIHTEFMHVALAEAKEAERQGEVPVGAVVVTQNGKFLAKAHNETIVRNDPTAHAEILALREAGKHLGNYRLSNTTFYVTVEPCVMCTGALIHARVGHLVYGTRDPKGGAVDSLYTLPNDPRLNHKIKVSSGILEKPCREIIQSFFKRLRTEKNDEGSL